MDEQLAETLRFEIACMDIRKGDILILRTDCVLEPDFMKVLPRGVSLMLLPFDSRIDVLRPGETLILPEQDDWPC